MFTVCPKCALTLVVTAADLRVAQGYVRCGRCSNVFNAIVGLSEDRGGGGSLSGTASTTITRKAPAISENEPPSDILADTGETEGVYAEPQLDRQEVTFHEVFVEAPRPAPPAKAAAPKPAPPATSAPPAASTPKPEFTDSVPDIALEFNPNETDISQVFVEAPSIKLDLRQITGSFEQIAPKPESAPPPQPQQPVQRQAPPPTPVQRQAPPAAPPPEKRPAPKRAAVDDVLVYHGSPYNSADAPANKARKAAADAARRRLAEREVSESPAVANEFMADNEEFDAPPPDDAGAYAAAAALTPQPLSRWRRLAWIGGSTALALVLAAQAIHHNRHDLATNPILNRPLTRFYATIGVPLVPRWNAALYEVRQLGAFSGAGGNGNLTVRASLKNTASQPLPLPLLRITVQDRYGNRIATRDVPPQGYVPGAVPEDPHLGAGQRIDAEMSFKDPGRDAVGFEIDACLPTPQGRIACANDVVTSAAR